MALNHCKSIQIDDSAANETCITSISCRAWVEIVSRVGSASSENDDWKGGHEWVFDEWHSNQIIVYTSHVGLPLTTTKRHAAGFTRTNLTRGTVEIVVAIPVLWSFDTAALKLKILFYFLLSPTSRY